MTTRIETFNRDTHLIPVWEMVITNYFYPDVVYYDFTGDDFYKRTWESDEKKNDYLESKYGKRNPNEVGKVLYQDDKIIGWVCWNWNEDPKKQKEAFLKYILVDESAERKGFGTLLLKEFINWCKENGKTKLSLQVQQGTSVEDFYKKNGFKYKFGIGFRTWEKTIRIKK